MEATTPILASWNATFDPAINWLKSVMSEFIPYVVYVWLGIVVAVLGFVAIRWLINWVRAKIFETF